MDSGRNFPSRLKRGRLYSGDARKEDQRAFEDQWSDIKLEKLRRSQDFAKDLGRIVWTSYADRARTGLTHSRKIDRMTRSKVNPGTTAGLGFCSVPMSYVSRLILVLESPRALIGQLAVVCTAYGVYGPLSQSNLVKSQVYKQVLFFGPAAH